MRPTTARPGSKRNLVGALTGWKQLLQVKSAPLFIPFPDLIQVTLRAQLCSVTDLFIRTWLGLANFWDILTRGTLLILVLGGRGGGGSAVKFNFTHHHDERLRLFQTVIKYRNGSQPNYCRHKSRRNILFIWSQFIYVQIKNSISHKGLPDPLIEHNYSRYTVLNLPSLKYMGELNVIKYIYKRFNTTIILFRVSNATIFIIH